MLDARSSPSSGTVAVAFGLVIPVASGPAADDNPTETDALGFEMDRHTGAAPALREGDRRITLSVELFGHLLGHALDCAHAMQVRGVAMDHPADVSRVERVTVHIRRGAAGAVGNGLQVTRDAARAVGARGARGHVAGPLTRFVEVGPGHARGALAVADVGATSVHEGEVHLEQLVADIKGEEEGAEGVRAEHGVQLALSYMHHAGRMVTLNDAGVVSLDRSRQRQDDNR